MDETTKKFLGTSTETVQGQERSKTVNAEFADKEYLEQAGKLTEEVINFLNRYAKSKELSAEQAVFAIALATINMRETAPNGKDWFDDCAWQAQEYYNKNK